MHNAEASLPTVRAGRQWYIRPYDFFADTMSDHKDTFYLRLPFQPKILTTGDPQLVREVLQNRLLVGGAGLKVLRPIIGERSTIMLSGPTHQERRKVVARIFEVITEDEKRALLNLFSSRIEQMAEGEEVKLYSVIQDLFLQHTVSFLFSGLPKKEIDHLCALTSAYMHAFTSPLFIFLKPFQFKFYGLTPWDRFLQGRKLLQQEMKRILTCYDHASLPKLRELRETIASIDEIVEEIIALILFGHDTSASALSWVVYNILSRPQWQQELIEGLSANPEHPLLAGCIAESHRLTPTVTQLIRQAEQDTTVAGHPIRRTQSVYISLVMLNRNPRVFENPHSFDPRRENHLPASLPFGAGTRLCVGKNLAETQIRIAASVLLSQKHFELSLPLRAYRPTRNNVIVAPGSALRVRRTRA